MIFITFPAMADLDLAVIGNCSVAALISRFGRIVWFCFPRLDGDPVFNALLGGEKPERGFMDITVAGVAAHTQRYLDNTAVVETEISDNAGSVVRILDFCPRVARFGRMFRPPMIVRRIEPASGRPRIALAVRPSFDYGAEVPAVSLGSNHIRFASPDTVLRLTADMSLSYLVAESFFTLDRPINLFLGPDETLSEEPNKLAQEFLAETIAYWQEWTRGLALPFDWQEAVIRAAITLKLCSYEDTGGIVAALTTSIPEAAGTERNWDYRFCWPRDSFFTVIALNRLGATGTMEQFIRYLIDAVLREERRVISPLYPIAPTTSVTERLIATLPGYQGMGPVRVGNAAFSQRQNDVFGAVILTAMQMFWDMRLPQQGDLHLYRRLRLVGFGARRAALRPDSGLWEFRGWAEIHTFSAAMCWAALDRLGQIAQRVGAANEAAAWRARAVQLYHEIFARACRTGKGWISGVLDGEFLDASVLLLPEIGFIPADDPCFLRTLAVVEKRLLVNGFVKRYDHPDDFGSPNTAFIVCTFWYIDALARAGRHAEARALFKNLLERRNHVGLLSEDIDPASGTLWGNFPQTYSQVGLILSAMRLSRSWEEGLWRAL